MVSMRLELLDTQSMGNTSPCLILWHFKGFDMFWPTAGAPLVNRFATLAAVATSRPCFSMECKRKALRSRAAGGGPRSCETNRNWWKMAETWQNSWRFHFNEDFNEDFFQMTGGSWWRRGSHWVPQASRAQLPPFSFHISHFISFFS